MPDNLDFARQQTFLLRLDAPPPITGREDIFRMFPRLRSMLKYFIVNIGGEENVAVSGFTPGTTWLSVMDYLGCSDINFNKREDGFSLMTVRYTPSIRISGTEVSLKNKSYEVYIQGCNRNCHGCHNPETHDFSGGEEVNIHDFLSKAKENISLVGEGIIDNIYVSGGDLLCQNPVTAICFSHELKNLFHDKTLWLFTGEKENGIPEWVWSYYDVVKCGPFVQSKLQRDDTGAVMFPASKNQKLILNKTVPEQVGYKIADNFKGETKWKK